MIESEGLFHLAYQNLVAVVIGAIKELHTVVSRLQTQEIQSRQEIEKLKSQLITEKNAMMTSKKD